jgi:hypothetical protein
MIIIWFSQFLEFPYTAAGFWLFAAGRWPLAYNFELLAADSHIPPEARSEKPEAGNRTPTCRAEALAKAGESSNLRLCER